MTPAGAPVTWRDLHDEARTRLEVHEVRWMVEEASGASWTELLLDPAAARVPEVAHRHFASMVERRAAGEPLQYVLGHWPFRTLDLMVDPRVLIPRPETEQVVEVALAELDRIAHRQEATVVDLGTGTGAIALSVAAERPRTRIWATDASPDALAVAQANLCGLGGFAATRVRIAHGSWWAALPPDLQHAVDLVVSNPPYISEGEMGSLDAAVVGWEPRTALEAGPTGLEAVVEILNDAARTWLHPQGAAVVEIAPHQGEAATAAARRAGFGEVFIRPDLAGRDRVLVARVARAARP